MSQSLPLFAHSVCAYTSDTKSVHTVVKMEGKRKLWKKKKGMQREAGTITRWPYLASVDNASRRCKLDMEWLSWRLDVAQWWFAVNLTTFAVWPLPRRRCYYESERDESERSRGREMWRCWFIPQCTAAAWPALKWLGLPQWHVSDRQTRR